MKSHNCVLQFPHLAHKWTRTADVRTFPTHSAPSGFCPGLYKKQRSSQVCVHTDSRCLPKESAKSANKSPRPSLRNIATNSNSQTWALKQGQKKFLPITLRTGQHTSLNICLHTCCSIDPKDKLCNIPAGLVTVFHFISTLLHTRYLDEQVRRDGSEVWG